MYLLELLLFDSGIMVVIKYIVKPIRQQNRIQIQKSWTRYQTKQYFTVCHSKKLTLPLSHQDLIVVLYKSAYHMH